MPHLSDRILSDKWGVVHSGAHLFFCFIFNPLIRGSRPHSFEDGTTLAIDCISIEDEYGNTPAQRAELDWLLYNKPPEYAQMVLRGETEHYLSLGCDHGWLED